jgi:hypothetical protein
MGKCNNGRPGVTTRGAVLPLSSWQICYQSPDGETPEKSALSEKACTTDGYNRDLHGVVMPSICQFRSQGED